MKWPANPELIAMITVFSTIVIAWFKLKPAMRKIESEDDISLRSDLLGRIKHLEEAAVMASEKHREEIREIRSQHDATVAKLNDRCEALCNDYEDKLRGYQLKVDDLLNTFIQLTGKPPPWLLKDEK